MLVTPSEKAGGSVAGDKSFSAPRGVLLPIGDGVDEVNKDLSVHPFDELVFYDVGQRHLVDINESLVDSSGNLWLVVKVQAGH